MEFVQDDAVFLHDFKWQPGTVQLATARAFNLFREEAKFLGARYPIALHDLTIQQIRRFSGEFSILTELSPKADGRPIKGRPNDDDLRIVLHELKDVAAVHTNATAAVDELHKRLNSKLFYDAAHIGQPKFYKPRAVACSKLIWLANPYIGIICDSIVLECVGLWNSTTPTIARYHEYCARIDALRQRTDTQTVMAEGMAQFCTLSNGFAFDLDVVRGRLYDQIIIIQDELIERPLVDTLPG